MYILLENSWLIVSNRDFTISMSRHVYHVTCHVMLHFMTCYMTWSCMHVQLYMIYIWHMSEKENCTKGFPASYFASLIKNGKWEIWEMSWNLTCHATFCDTYSPNLLPFYLMSHVMSHVMHFMWHVMYLCYIKYVM